MELIHIVENLSIVKASLFFDLRLYGRYKKAYSAVLVASSKALNWLSESRAITA